MNGLEEERSELQRKLDAINTDISACRTKLKETEKKREVSQESSQLWKRHIEILTEKWPAETEAVLEGSAFVSVPEGGCFTSC